jgi:glycosyltransferase involved in cell wall biosynthesis
MYNPTVSIITVCLNSAYNIEDTIRSVLSQTYNKVEYIVIDGASTDGTIDIIESFGGKISKFISQPDKGIYDAINKGIKNSSGEIIGILNSDDFFCDNYVIENVVAKFKDEGTDAVIGDVQFVDAKHTNRIVRYYSSKKFRPRRFRFGMMPAHPGFYTKRIFFEEYGYYKPEYRIAGDFELLIRFLNIHKLRYKYLNMPVVSMRTGGISNRSFLSNIIINKEIMKACKANGIKTNYIFIYSKYFLKSLEFLNWRFFK